VNKLLIFHFSLIALLFLTACEDPKGNTHIKKNPPTTAVEVPKFDHDYAYQLIEQQLAFGPRIPGTKGHANCAAWLVETLESYGAKTILQQGEISGHRNKVYQLKNVIATINPVAQNRILLCAHWDSRAMADQDPDDPTAPVPGADDGGSGVAILMEIAERLQKQPLKNTGVDIVLFDAEDQGISEGGPMSSKTWCLGAQYWSKNPHIPNYKAQFGILLDMVGSKGARFPKEGVSMKFASAYVEKVWKTAARLGYQDFFVNEVASELIDDHLFVNEIRNIPTLDIINQPLNSESRFGSYWHTQKDNITIISKSTLAAVGQTLLQVLYEEDARIQ